MTKRSDYAPYDQLLAFDQGMKDYRDCLPCPYSGDSVEGQAWDRGAEYQMKLERNAVRTALDKAMKAEGQPIEVTSAAEMLAKLMKGLKH